MDHNIKIIEIVWIFKEFGIYRTMSLVTQIVMVIIHIYSIMVASKYFYSQRRTDFEQFNLDLSDHR